MSNQIHRGTNIFVVWGFAKTRAIELAKRMGLKILSLNLNNRIPVIIRYILSSINTFLHLIRRNPDIIMIQIPPIISVLPIYIYTIIFGGNYIVDVHSGELIDKKWRPFSPLRHFLLKRSLLNLVHNHPNYVRLKNEYIHNNILILNDPLPEPYNVKGKRVKDTDKEAIIISTYSSDEPYRECLKAAKILKGEWTLVFTGNASRVNLENEFNDNVHFTGMIKYSEYWSLLRGADVIVSLNKRDEVITCGIWEALSLKKPLVTSDNKCVREVLGKCAVFTKNKPSDIANAIKIAYNNSNILKARMQEKTRILRKKNKLKCKYLNKLIEQYKHE